MTTETTANEVDELDDVSVRHEPKTRALRRFTGAYALGTLGTTLFWGAAGMVLLPLQVQGLELHHYFNGADAAVDLTQLANLKHQVDAGAVVPTAEQARLLDLYRQYDTARASSLSVIHAVAAACTLLLQPIIGVLSDHTHSRWGRRAPWIAAGAVAGAGLTIAMRFAPTIGALVVLWSLVSLAVNTVETPRSATVADRVPAQRIATTSAVTGVIGYFGAIAASFTAGQLFAAIGLDAYYPLAIAMLLLSLLFVVIAPDRSSKDMPRRALHIRAVLGAFVSALRDRDYRWVWTAKLLFAIGYAMAGTYAVYMLQSYVRPALSADDAAQTAPLLQMSALPLTLIAMVVAARWSDRIGRRKPFVIGASLVMAVSFLIPVVWPTLPAFFIQAIVAGLGYGAFLVVDQALFIDVLPDKHSAGRDLGLAQGANNLGNAIAPVIAGGIIALAAGSYNLILPMGCAIVVLAALAILPVRRAR